MKKLLVVFNTCGINRNENIAYYNYAVNSIIDQDLDSYDVVISSCLASEQTKDNFNSVYGDKVDRIYVDERVPVNVTFNLAVIEAVKRHGPYEGYMYIDSGIHLTGQPDTLRKLYDIYKSGPFGMVAGRTNTDTGADQWFGCTNEELFRNGPVVIPVGRAVNLHIQIFSNRLFEFYGKLIPDCFASYCTESVFSFVTAAINQKWIIANEPVVYHQCGMDGGSAGFNPLVYKRSGGDLTNHGFCVPSVHNIMKGGHEYGMGYEECASVVVHKPEKYDENGYCIDPQLKYYIRDNVFLSKDKFDYDKINFQYLDKVSNAA